MASLRLDPDATYHELYRAREACSFALRWLTHPDCRLPARVRHERIADLVDAVRVHDLALDALDAEVRQPRPDPAWAGPRDRRRSRDRRR